MHRLPATSKVEFPHPVEENEASSWDDYDDAFLDSNNGVVELGNTLSRGRDLLESLSASTPCMTDSRPSSSIDVGIDWEDPWLRSVGNSDSCLTTGSSCGTSPLNGIPGQRMSPSMENDRSFLYEFSENADKSVSSLNDALRTERDFMEFVMSSFPLPASTPSSQQMEVTKKSPSDSSPKVGLDHLDNLCKLMEQLSDLKEANVKLKRRVQYLEDIRTLHEIHKEMTGQTKAGALILCEDEARIVDQDNRSPQKSSSAEENSNLFPDNQERSYGLYRSKTSGNIEGNQELKRGGLHKSRTTSAIAQERIRERSKSVGHPGTHSKGKKRSSRWSKVKEALGIERLDNDSEEFPKCSCSGDVCDTDQRTRLCVECRNQSDLDTSNVCTSVAVARNEENKPSSRQRTAGLSSNSFSMFQHQILESNPGKKSGTLDCPQTAQKFLEQLEKEENHKKSPKGPWGRMKTMIQGRRDIRHHKSESSSNSSRGIKEKGAVFQNEDHHSNGNHHQRRSGRNSREFLQDIKHGCQDGVAGHEGYQEVFHLNDGGWKEDCPGETSSRLKREALRQLGHQPKNNSHHRQHSKESQDIRDVSHQQQQQQPQSQKEKPLDRHKLTSKSLTSSKEAGKRKKPKPKPLTLQDELIHIRNENVHFTEEERDTPKTPGSSPQLQKKWVWTKVKDVLKGKRDDGARLSISVPSSPSSSADVVAFNFQSAEGEALAEDSAPFPYAHPVPILPDEGYLEKDHPGNTTTMNDLLRELQQNLSDDFNKKLEEWQKLRNEGAKLPSPSVERKDSFGKFRKISKPDKKIPIGEKMTKHNSYIQKKDISWLDKELQKVEREILRLSKEKQKFEKRAFRLKRLKEAMMDAQKKKEVLVRTSAGEFRFEGISDAFTKKLYEWETKKGVLPELSTIALLDESLSNKPPKHSENHQRDSRSVTDLCEMTPSSSRSSPSPEPTVKNCFQASRASSEPDLSALSSQKEGAIQGRSKSGDTLLTTVPSCEMSGDDLLAREEEEPRGTEGSTQFLTHSRETPQTEDNYYCLLEENMFLLDQLKNKEEFCRHLQRELDRLDRRSDKVDRNHEEEMDKYRRKLWEIHMSRPRDLQGSLQLIGELKTRIEELKKCSDRLKSDREALEENFRYHSEQQAHLAEDLIQKVLELQQEGSPIAFRRSGSRRKWKKAIKCNPFSISRVQDLSTKLLQQAREMDQTLIERTRQICQLRWELLQRDMSAVLLQAALHRINWQGESPMLLSAWDKKKAKLKDLKAWSIDTTIRCQSEESVAEGWVHERLRQFSLTPQSEMPSIEFNTSDLMSTVHELKKETLRMTTGKSDLFSETEDHNDKATNGSAESEMADSDRYYDTGSAVNSRSSSFSSGQGCLRGSHSDTRLYERSRRLSNRRNSSSSMSCLSGMDASDSSSIHESDRINFLVHRRPWPRWRSRENVSSSCSSQSSIVEDDVRNYPSGRSKNPGEDEANGFPQQLRIRYESFKEDEENAERSDEDIHSFIEKGSKCLITPRTLHVGFNILSPSISETASVERVSKLVSPPDESSSSTLLNSPAYRPLDLDVQNSIGRNAEALDGNLFNTESPFTESQCAAKTSENENISLNRNSLDVGALPKGDAISGGVIPEYRSDYHIYENTELLSTTFSVPEPLMNDECLRYSTIFYPSSQSPCNSDNDTSYSGVIPHTNTDASNTSSEHSEVEILNIVHPLQELMTYATFPNIQKEMKWRMDSREEVLAREEEVLERQRECAHNGNEGNGEEGEKSDDQTHEDQRPSPYPEATDFREASDAKIQPRQNLYEKILCGSGIEREDFEDDFRPFGTFCDQFAFQGEKSEALSSLNEYSENIEASKLGEAKSILPNTCSDMEQSNDFQQCAPLPGNDSPSAYSVVAVNGNQNIKQIKYKGTKGFGKSAKSGFRKDYNEGIIHRVTSQSSPTMTTKEHHSSAS